MNAATNISKFLKKINSQLPQFLSIIPYENSEEADFELVITPNSIIGNSSLVPSNDFIELVKKIGSEYFTDTPKFNNSKVYFWFG